MKYIIILVVLASAGSIIYGFSIEGENLRLANKCIGFGTVGLFLVAMPLFLIRAGKGKNVKNYMFTEENIKKMQDKEKENTENQ